MIEELKKTLLDNPYDLIELLEQYNFYNVKLHNNEIRCGISEQNNQSSVCIKLINNPYLFIKDYGRNICNDIFAYIMQIRKVQFTDVLNSVKQILNIDSFYESESHQIFGGFYNKIQTRNSNVVPKIYDKSILNKYELRANKRFMRDNIDIETQMKFGIRYDIESQRIVIPIYDIYGNLIGVKGRANWNIEDGESKYLYLVPCAMSQTLFGYSVNYRYLVNSTIYIFEAEKSVMQASAFGIYNCVSIGGNSLSPQQCKILLELNPKIIVFMLDKGLDDEVLKRDIKVLRSFCRMRDVQIKYWLANDDIPNKASPTDMGQEKFNEIVNTQLKEVDYEQVEC